MSADTYKAVTDFLWDDETRPEVQIHGNHAVLEVGGEQLAFEIKCDSQADLQDRLNGYAEIFKAAAEMLNE